MSHTDKIKVALSLAFSPSSVSLSADPTIPSLELVVSAKVITSPRPTSPITICTDGTALDNGQHTRHDGIFRGAFLSLRSTTDPQRWLQLAFSGHPNYGSQPKASPNLRELPWMRFETIPPTGQGNLVIKHSLSLDRIFQYTRYYRRAIHVQPGEIFCIGMNPARLYSEWWSFGSLDDETLGQKKFSRLERPHKGGIIGNLAPGQQLPDAREMEMEGWVLSQPFDNLVLVEGGNSIAVIEFVE